MIKKLIYESSCTGIKVFTFDDKIHNTDDKVEETAEMLDVNNIQKDVKQKIRERIKLLKNAKK